MKQSNTMMGTVLRTERSSIHDGQGLRTVVFLKGCPLKCLWCSTPESQNPDPELGYAWNSCVGCGTCVASCPGGALSSTEDGSKIKYSSSSCRKCFNCVTNCPRNALKKYGTYMSAEEVLGEITKDEIFFFHSEGGVTLSGGEPLSQADFVSEILRNCKGLGIHTAMETSLQAPWEKVKAILEWLDVIYVDIKHMDPQHHKRLVGTDNSLILDNLCRIDQSPSPVHVIVRVPMIPGINDSDTNLAATAGFCKTLKRLKEIELLPYHRLGMETYKHLQLEYTLQDVKPSSQEEILERAKFLSQQKPGVPIRVGGGFIKDNLR